MLESTRTALIFGSSGLVGSRLLELLLETSYYDHVKVFVRNPILVTHKKLLQIITDFENPDNVQSEITGDDMYICLGTTMAKAGSQEAFYKVDYTYCVQIALRGAANHVNKVVLISSMGADSRSLIYYSKVKGEVEEAIGLLDFESVGIVRPSLLLGERKENRIGERIFTYIAKNTNFLFFGPLKKYRPIEAKKVATAMLNIGQTMGPGVHTYDSKVLQELGLTINKFKSK